MRKEVIGDCTLYLGDCLEIMPTLGKVDAVVTDPPYPKEFIECWSKLGEISFNLLREGGLCFAYSGQTHLVEVLNRLSEWLDYWWQLSLIHSGGSQSIHHRNIMCGYKPILMFSKGKPEFVTGRYFRDTIKGAGRSKQSHPWEQALSELGTILLHYTLLSQAILDPFMGSGTTGVACVELGRRFVGIEIDEKYFDIACERISRAERQGDLFRKPTAEQIALI